MEAQGGEYHHFLQPNQYVEGSKVLTQEELATAIAPGAEPGRLAAAGYPKLRRQGHALAKRGVRFHDATPIYQNEPRTVYADTCCHVNELGNETLARFMVDRILATTDLEALGAPAKE